MNRPRRSIKPIERYGAAGTEQNTPSQTPTKRVAASSASKKAEGGGRGAKRSRVEEEDEDEEEASELSEPEEDDDFDEEDYDSPPPAKRARKSTGTAAAACPAPTQRKGRKGKLSAFAALPMDTIFDVAKLLDPFSLISLSRVNRILRSELIAKSGEPIWAAVREAAGMPRTTTGKMTDRAFILLYVSKKCMICNTANGPIIDYTLKVRFCKPCQLDNVIWVNKVTANVPGYPPQVDADLVDYFIPAEPPVGKTHNRVYTFIPSAQAFLQQLYDLYDEASTEEIAAFKAECLAYKKAAVQDSEAIRDWFGNAAFRQSRAGQDAENARIDAIVAKVEALGHDGRDVRYAHSIYNLLHQPRPLTDAIWKRISADVIAATEKQRVDRLRREEANKLMQERWAKQREEWEEQRRAKLEKESALARAAAKAKVEADLAAPTSTVPARYVRLFNESKAVTTGTNNDRISRQCGKDPMAVLSQQDYAAFFSPYLHYLPCRLCHPNIALFPLSDFLIHKAEAHGVVDQPIQNGKLDKSGLDRDSFHDPAWSTVLAEALRQAGLPPSAPGQDAILQLEQFGEHWSCESCTGALSTKNVKWSEMVKHIRTTHRGAAIRVSGNPRIKLAPSVAPAPASAPPVASSSATPLASTSSSSSSFAPSRPVAPLPPRPTASLSARPVMPLQARQQLQRQQQQQQQQLASVVPRPGGPTERRTLASYADML